MSALKTTLEKIEQANKHISQDMTNNEVEAFFKNNSPDLFASIQGYTNYNDVQNKASEFWPEFYEKSTKALKNAIKMQENKTVHRFEIGRL